MRKKIVAGNWKMNTTVPEGVELAKAVVEKSAQVAEGVGLVIATPFTHLVPVADVVKGTRVQLSAENCADKEKGAYTGEVSAAMLASAGCEYTILGHSERRQYYGETSCCNSKFGRCFVCDLIQAALYSCVGILQAEIKYIALVGFKFPHGLSSRHLNTEPKHKPALADFT